MSKNYRILHLVKEREEANFVFEVLQSRQYDFKHLTVNSSKSFVEALKKANPHVVLVNDGFPSLTLNDALQICKDFATKIPVIILSDNESAQFAMALIRKGADDYVLKNDLRELPSIIQKLIQKKKEKGNVLEGEKSGDQKFRSFVESGDNALMVFTPDGKTSYISPAAEKILGFSQVDLSKVDITRIIHIDDVQPALDYMALCLKNPGVPAGTITARVKHKDGTWRWMEACFTNLLHDEDVRGILNNFKEVTGQTEAEVALKKSEEKYRAFFEHSLDGILLTAPDGRIFAANAAACEMFQRTEKEICEVGRAGIVDLNDPRVMEAVRERQKSGKILVEINMVRKDGSIFPAALSSSVFEGVNEEELTSIIIRDISKAKRAEEELKASERKHRQLFQNSPLPNLIYDVNTFEILDLNESASNLYGFSREEFLQLTVVDLLPEKHRRWFAQNLSRVITSGNELSQHTITSIKKDGEPIQVEVYGYNLQYKGRNCRLVVGLDITEKEMVMQKLEEKSKKLLWAERLAKFGYWEVGVQDNTFFWSDEVYRIWGRRKEDFQVGLEDFLQTIHPDDVNQFMKEQEVTLSGKRDLDYQHRIVLPDGSIKWVHERGKLVKSSNGQPVKFEGSVQDITNYKNAMLKLEQSEGRQRALLTSQTNYLMRMDLQGDYTYVNDKFASDFNWIFSDGQFVGQCSTLAVKEYHHAKVASVFEKCIANPNTVYQVEIDKLQENGEGKPTLWDLICLTDSGGNPVEVQGVGIDITERVEAERSLIESNTRYELVSKATSDAIYDWDIRTDHVFWGEAFYTLFNYSPDTFSPTIDSWLECVHPQEKLPLKESLIRTIEGTENRWEVEYRFKKADGKYALVVEKGFILRDQNGKAFRMVGAIQDVTVRKKLEELLDEASRFARIGSFELDFEQNSLYWSPVTKEIHEVDIDFEPNYETGIQFYKEGESRDMMIRAFKKAVEQNIPYDLELQIVTAKGHERWVRKIGKPTFVDGKCVRINGSFQDISNIKNSELKALKASEEKQVILESIGDAFFAVDDDWTITYFNKHAKKLLNVSKEEVIGNNLWEVFSDAVDTKFYTQYHKAVKEQSVENFEEYFARVDKWLDVSAYPSNSGLSVYFRDVTDRKRSELKILELNKNLKAHTKELVQANKGLEQFSFIVSHNLRSPVANVLGLAELIRSDEYPAEVKENFLNELFNNVQRLDNVITDLNDILHVRMEVDSIKEPVILEDLVNSIKSSIGNIVEKEGVEINTAFEVPQMQTVQSYLYSIFYNLITNSIKYRRTGVSSKIKIRSEERNGDIIISFEDNGLGIDMAKKGEQLFGLYKRFHNHVEGKGMGLFLVKTQVQLLGGRISVESEVNRGTEFKIAFKAENTNLIFEDDKETSFYSN